MPPKTKSADSGFLKEFHPSYKLEKFLPTIAVYYLGLIYFSFALFRNQPGLLSYDGETYLLKNLQGRSIIGSNWFPFETQFYKSMVHIALKLHPSFLALNALQVFLGATTIAYGFYLNSEKLKMPISGWGGALFCIFVPVNALMLILSERDVLFSWLSILALLQIFHLHLSRPKPHQAWLRFLLLGITLSFVTGLRTEGIIQLPSTLLILFFCLKRSFRELLVFSIFLLGTCLCIQKGLPRLYNADKNASAEYRSAVLIRRIAMIERATGDISLSKNESSIIAPFIRHNHLLKFSKDFSPAIILNPDISELQHKALSWYFFHLIIKHPSAFLKVCAVIMRNALADIMPRSDISKSFRRVVYFPLLSKQSGQQLWTWLESRSNFLSLLLIPLFGALFCVYCVLYLPFFLKKLTLISVMAVTPFFHLLTVFFFQPAANPKYLYYVYLFPIFFMPLFIFEMKTAFARQLALKNSI